MAGYIGNKQKISGRYKVDEFTSSGGTTYTLSATPGEKNNIQVSAGGLVQYPSAYSVSGTTLTLTGVPSGQKVVVRHMGDTIPYPLLDADAVDGTKIADDALDSEHYTNGSIDDAHIADMAASKLTGTITPSDNTVTGAKIALGSDAAGDIMYNNGTDYVRLAPGTSGQFLKTLGASANPAWGTVTTDTSGAWTPGTATTGKALVMGF